MTEIATSDPILHPVRPTGLDAARETIESIAVAFMLAFMFKTFLAEMFVIPTGSMAPTLQGRHFDLFCPECGEEFRCGFSENRPIASPPVCPNCRYTVQLDPKNKNDQPFMGDRITVNKFLYDFDAPQRWDVIVFKYPEDAKTNYIKRLIGLPGERLRIYKGDIYTTKLDPETNLPVGEETIARKPNHVKLQAMLQHVYDTDHVDEKFLARGWPSRWSDWSAQQRTNGWTMSTDGREFKVAADAAPNATLRYRHFVPQENDWRDFKNQPNSPLAAPASPRYIEDFYAYNVGSEGPNNEMYWVGDLALECEATTTGNGGTITLDLVKGGIRFLATIDTATGTAKLSIPRLPDYAPPEAKNVWQGAGTHKLLFANVDDQLTLLVDGEPVFAPETTGFTGLNNETPTPESLIPQLGDTDPNDLSPLGITVTGGETTIRHLRVLRDVYYWNTMNRQNFNDPGQFIIDLLDLPIDDHDQFFMLGDNSPSSSDGRLWANQKYVERRLLIGKAVYIYWPHSWATSWSVSFKSLGLDFDIPFVPNFKRMRLIH